MTTKQIDKLTLAAMETTKASDRIKLGLQKLQEASKRRHGR